METLLFVLLGLSMGLNVILVSKRSFENKKKDPNKTTITFSDVDVRISDYIKNMIKSMVYNPMDWHISNDSYYHNLTIFGNDYPCLFCNYNSVFMYVPPSFQNNIPTPNITFNQYERRLIEKCVKELKKVLNKEVTITF